MRKRRTLLCLLRAGEGPTRLRPATAAGPDAPALCPPGPETR
ncbi:MULTISPECIES: hypothetical protein [Nocardia]|nr:MULTISPECIES: hypothetical protein [Nocardia]